MVVFVGIALLKPWGDRPEASREQAVDTPPPSHGRSSSADLIAPAEPLRGSTWAAVPFVPGPEPAFDAAVVRANVRARNAWGIRAVVDESAAQGTPGRDLRERWASALPGGGVSPATNGYPIRAMGVTLPAGTVALDVRVTREVRGRERWVDAEPVAGSNPGAAVLFWPPRGANGWPEAWEPGEYRFYILTVDGVVDLAAFLPGGTVQGDAPATEAPLWNGSVVRGGWLGLDSNLAEGPFAGVIPPDPRAGPDGPLPVVLPLAGRSAATLDLAAAWLGSAAGRDPGGTTPTTASVYLPRAVALGAGAPAGSTIDGARLVRLLPGDPLTRPLVLDDVPGVVTNIDDIPYQDVVRFEAPGGAPWPAGVYAIEVAGSGPGGTAVRSYGITLLPGSARAVPVPLAATRAWARFAGRWGVAAGLLEPLDGPARLAVRYAAQAPEPTVSGAADFSRRCLYVNLIDTAQPILGLGHPVDAAPDSIQVQQVFLDGTRALPAPAVARAVIPGLSLVAAGDGSTWAPGWYRLIVTQGTASSALPFCVGSVTGSVLAVPPQAGLSVRDVDVSWP
jgi:hypothetical protein